MLKALSQSTKLVAIAVVCLVILPPAPARAASENPRGVVDERPVDGTIQFVDGETHVIEQADDMAIVGGTFTKVGPGIQGAAAPLDLGSSEFRSTFPDIAGAVNAAVSDGSGGYYLAGSFAAAGGTAVQNVVHINGESEVTGFRADTDAVVTSLALDSGALYLGGDFTTVNGTPAQRVARVDRNAGTLVWGASANSTVHTIALAAGNTRLLIGGDFTKIGTEFSRRLASLDVSNGEPDVTFVPGTVSLTVRTILVQGDSAWFGGSFTKVNDVTRHRLAKVNVHTGLLDPIDLRPNNDVSGLALSPNGQTLVLVGRFDNVSGEPRRWLAAVDTEAGSLAPLSVSGFAIGEVMTAAFTPSAELYIGGSFVLVPEKTRPSTMARVNLATSEVAEVVPPAATPLSLTRPAQVARNVLALVPSGNDLLVAGDFSDFGIVTRNHIAAYNLTTGALSPTFNPSPNGTEVNTIESTSGGEAIYVGGQFDNIAGVNRTNLAKLDVTSGAADPAFNATTDSFVKEITLTPDNSRLLVGGGFGKVNGETRSKLASLDPVTGQVHSDFQIGLTVPSNQQSGGALRAMSLSPDGSRLMVIGDFRLVGGLDRPLMGQIDLTTSPPSVSSWRTRLYDRPCSQGNIGQMRDVDISPDGQTVYVVSSGHFFYPACDAANAFPMSGGGNIKPLWIKKVGDTLETVTSTRDTVYIGGHFRYLENETQTEDRFQVGALDARTGEGLNWAPNADGFRGVLTLESKAAGIFIGTDGDSVNQVPHGRFALWATPRPGLELFKKPVPSFMKPGGATTYRIEAYNTYEDRSISLANLTDSRLGSLAGKGTCGSFPKSIAAGTRFTCEVAETIQGAHLEVVNATLTGSGSTSSGDQVTDTDKSTVELLDNPPVFAMRLSVGPTLIPFPGGPAQFAIAVMNLDQVNPATLTSLTSPTYGNLDDQGECDTPQTIEPNALYYCSFSATVSGPVGTRSSTAVTGTATTDGVEYNSTVSVNNTISAPTSGTELLYVVSNPTALSSSEQAIHQRLDVNYDVELADDDTVQPADTIGKSLVLISSSIGAAAFGDRLAGVEAAVMPFKHSLYDDFKMTAGNANQGILTTDTVNITNLLHQLATAKSGPQLFASVPKTMSYGVPGSGAEVVAELGPGQATIFSYAPGATLADGSSSPGCRVAFPAMEAAIPKLTPEAYEMFDRAVAYGIAGCGKGLLSSYAGNNTSDYPGDGQPAASVGFDAPWGMALGPNGVYLADAGNNAVRLISPSGLVATVAGTGSAGNSGDGGPATAARLNGPSRIRLDPSGNLFIADTGNATIRKVSPTGVITTVAGTGSPGFSGDGGPATSAKLGKPKDMDFDAAGNLYIADTNNNRIRKVSAAGIISTFAGNGSAGYAGDGGPATSARLQTPYGVDLDAAGNLYIADYNNERVRLVSGGTITTFAGNGVASTGGDGGPAAEANLHKPAYVMVAPNGDVYICEFNNNRVRKVESGTIDTIAGTGTLGLSGDGSPPIFATFRRPSATALDGKGNLFIADRVNHLLRVVWAS